MRIQLENDTERQKAFSVLQGFLTSLYYQHRSSLPSKGEGGRNSDKYITEHSGLLRILNVVM